MLLSMTLICPLYSNSYKNLIADIDETFSGQPAMAKALKKAVKKKKLPYEHIILKIREGKKKNVPLQTLETIVTNLLSYYYQLEQDKNTVLKAASQNKNFYNNLFGYLTDFAVAKQSYAAFKKILILALEADMTQAVILDIYDTFLLLISYGTSEQTALRFCCTLIREQEKLQMITFLDFYLAHAIIKQINVNNAILALLNYNGIISRKKMLNYIEDIE